MAATILAIDQGTTGSTCLVVELDDRTGTRIVSRGYAEVPQHFPKPGWVEHDLDEIWSSVQIAAREALDRAGIDGKKLAAIGITNQRETSGLWDRHGQPVHRALVWQDRRTADTCRALAAAGHEKLFRSRTGLVLDPYFSGTKLAWLLANVDGLAARARNGELRFGTIDTWLVHKLTGGEQHVTDVTNASRTLLFDIHRRAWDDELAERLGGIPRALLPEVRSSSEVYGHTRGAGVIPDGIPIAGIAGDQQAALFGQACFEPGMAKCTYGTGAFALVNTGAQAVPSERGLITTIAWQVGGQVTYALEGSVFIAGAAVQWLRDGLGIIQSSSEIEALAASVPDTGGVTFVPALTGLGAPHWNPDARGVLLGLTRGTGRGHIARATLEGIALQIADLLGAMQADAGRGLEVVRVDGGAAANALLMQFQADVLGVALDRPSVLDTTALGAAYLAALGAGCMASTQQIVSSWQLERRFVPGMARAAVDEKRRAWTAAVAKA